MTPEERDRKFEAWFAEEHKNKIRAADDAETCLMREEYRYVWAAATEAWDSAHQMDVLVPIDRYEALQTDIQNLRAVTALCCNKSAWRNADQYKPELHQEVLIYHCLGDSRRANHAYDVAWWFGPEKGWTFPWDRNSLPVQKPRWVVAWMPLPSSPDGDND